MAGIAFINDGRKSYLPYITWCYLPVRPLWYRLVLSWVPRYLILIGIISIYVSIFIYVRLQYRAVMFNFSQSQTYVDFDNDRTIIRKLKRTRRTMKSILSYCPGFGFLDDQQLQRNAATHRMDMDVRASAIAEFQRESVLKFQIRKSLIERQLTLIFIYPAAYVFLWLAPLALQCLQYNYVFTHGTVFCIDAVAAFMKPFICVFYTIAFMIRERPWRVHKE
jgi:G protein-coupled receptor GPR1